MYAVSGVTSARCVSMGRVRERTRAATALEKEQETRQAQRGTQPVAAYTAARTAVAAAGWLVLLVYQLLSAKHEQ